MHLAPSDLKKSRFEPLQASTFFVSDVAAEDAATRAELAFTLTSIQSRRSPPNHEQYSMLFLGPQTPILPQAIYRFRHEAIGELPLFMVPVGSDEEGTQYEVCVARDTKGD